MSLMTTLLILEMFFSLIIFMISVKDIIGLDSSLLDYVADMRAYFRYNDLIYLA